MNLKSIVLSAFINDFAEIIAIHKIADKKLNLKSLNLYFSYLLMVLLTSLNFIFSNTLIKAVVTLFIMTLLSALLFKKSFRENFTIAVSLELLTIIAEVFFAIIITVLNNIDTKTFASMYEGSIIANIIISLIIIIISYTKIFSKFYKKIFPIIKNISKIKVTIFLGTIIMTSNVLFSLSYYKTGNILTIILNIFVTILYFSFILYLAIKEHKYNKMYVEYLLSLNKLEEYEEIINEYRIINHENKNQLNSIKGLTKNYKVHEYIDEILNSKNKRNDSIIKQALLIPTGGLRGLIYSKIVIMKKKKINYFLNVDKKINSKLIKKLSTKTMLDVCQIIGVYLDNAIETVEKLIEKQILISFHFDNDIEIEITNNIEEEVNINKINKIGYTSKNEGHGYGLALVDKIINDNSNLYKETNVKNMLFKQKLIIKVNNKKTNL